MYTRRLLVSCIGAALLTSLPTHAVDTKAAAKATAQLSQAQAGQPQSNTNKAATTFSQAQLDQMLAPIALYPDTVLTHVLIAATYPLEIVKATRWLSQQGSKTSEQLLKAAENEEWDPSVRALVAFPNILTTFNNDLDWTQNVGDAFLVQPKDVMASIQRLREKAYAAGSLKNQDYYTVERKEKVIVIEPRSPEVVYVPVYDTRYVYGDWWWRDYPPVYWNTPVSYRSSSYFYWGAGVRVAPGFYFSTVYWPRQEVIVVPHYRPARYYRSYDIYHHEERRYWEHESYHRRGVEYRGGYVPEHHRDYIHTQERQGGRDYRRDSAHDRIEERQRDPMDSVRDRLEGRGGERNNGSFDRYGEPRGDAGSTRPQDTLPTSETTPAAPAPVTDVSNPQPEPSSPMESVRDQLRREKTQDRIEVPRHREPMISDDNGPQPVDGRLETIGNEKVRVESIGQPVLSQPTEGNVVPVPQEPVRSEPVFQEPVRSEPVFQEPVRSEPVFQEPVRSEPVFQEPVRSEPVFQEPVRSEPVFQEPVRSEPVFQEPVRSEPVFQEPVRSEPVFQEPVRSEPVYQEPVRMEPPQMETSSDGRPVE